MFWHGGVTISAINFKAGELLALHRDILEFYS